MKFSLKVPAKVYAGNGSIANIADILKAESPSSAALFTDKVIRSLGLTVEVERLLADYGKDYSVIDDIPSEPKACFVDDIINKFNESGADFIVAVGGGSVMDVAKLASVTPQGRADVHGAAENPSTLKKRAKTCLIPTTAGTGSEATPNAIVTFPERELKIGVVNEQMTADYVVLDADMIKKIPSKIAAATGVDALAHAIECYTSNKATPFSDMYAMEAMRLIFPNIERAVLEPEAIQAKSSMQLASFYAGVAIAAAGTTAVHALAYPLGGKYGIAHGVSNAILLSPVMSFNSDAVSERLESVYDTLCPQNPVPQAEKAPWVINRISDIVNNLSIPKKLTEFGVSSGDIDTLVDSAFEVKRLLSNNRKTLGKADIRYIYEQLF